jgi:hypothetical protein
MGCGLTQEIDVNAADRATLAEFASLFRACAVCWWPESDGRRRMEIHHLQQGAGRKHDRRNLLTLCDRCHCVLHSGKICGMFPDLNKGILLTAKQESDPEFFDPAYLASLRHKKHLGYEPEPIPAFYLEERESNVTRYRRG